MDIEVRNSPQLKKLIDANPTGARDAVIDWEQMVKNNPELQSIKSYEEWLTWASQHPGTDTTLWVGREIQVVSADPEAAPRPTPEQDTKPIQLPLSDFFGSMIARSTGGIKPLILQHDWVYQKEAHNKQQEWLKKNGKEDFASKEGVDFLYGSLDDPKATNLHEETEKEIRKKAEKNKGLAKRIQQYDTEKSKTYKNINDDPLISHFKFQIQAHAHARHSLLQKENPDIKFDDVYKDVKEKSWEQFAIQHPEKIKVYLTDAYKNTNTDLKEAVERIEKRQVVEKTAEAEKTKKIETPQRNAPKEGAHFIEDIMGVYNERYPQKGLADLPKQKDEDNQSLQMPPRKVVDELIKDMNETDAAEELLQQAADEENYQDEEQQQNQQRQQEKSQQPQSSRRTSSNGRKPSKIPRIPGISGGGGSAARVVGGAGARMLLIYVGIPALVVLIIVIIVLILIIGFEDQAPPPGTSTPGVATQYCKAAEAATYESRYGFYPSTNGGHSYANPRTKTTEFSQIKEKAIKWAPVHGVDPVLVAWWVFFETGNNNDSYKFSNCGDSSRDINHNCSSTYSGGWQLGYGQQFATYPQLPAAFTKIYGDANDATKTQEVGQNVFTKAGQNRTFPLKSVNQLMNEYKAGNTDARYLISVLMRDPDISVYMLAPALKNISRDTAFGWSSYYKDNWQKTSNLLNDVLVAWNNDTRNCESTNPTVSIVPSGPGFLSGIVDIASNIVSKLRLGARYYSIKQDEPGVYYWCTYLIVDVYKSLGITGLSRGAHGAVLNMQEYFRNTQANGGKLQLLPATTPTSQLQPGDVVFLVGGAAGSGRQHVSLIKSIEVDQNGHGAIKTLDSNNVVLEDTISVRNNRALKAATVPSYAITGFGRATGN